MHFMAPVQTLSADGAPELSAKDQFRLLIKSSVSGKQQDRRLRKGVLSLNLKVLSSL